MGEEEVEGMGGSKLMFFVSTEETLMLNLFLFFYIYIVIQLCLRLYSLHVTFVL